MTRYDAEHKKITRSRIVETAGKRFKTDGIDGSGIAVLMADAGLTNGAFYAHFGSKNDLVASVVEAELRKQNDILSALPPGRAGLEGFLRRYLSTEHRDAPGDGCASAALLDELARCDAAAKRAYTDGARLIVDTLAKHLSPRSPQSARGRALALYTVMVGAVQLSRALSDDDLSREVLEQGTANALKLLR